MKIQSHNSNSKSFARQLLVPSPVQLMLYTLTGIAILVIANTEAIWSYLSDNPAGIEYSTKLFGSGYEEGLLGSSIQGRLSQIVIWSLAGILIYTVIWFLRSIFINLRNDIVADAYVHPHSYNRAGYWKSIAFRKVFFIGIIAILIGFLYLFLQLFPVFSSAFFNMVIDFSANSFLKAIAAILSLTILSHVFLVIIHLAINSWKFIHADL